MTLIVYSQPTLYQIQKGIQNLNATSWRKINKSVWFRSYLFRLLQLADVHLLEGSRFGWWMSGRFPDTEIMYVWCSKFNIRMQISEFSAGCSLLIIALPVHFLLKTQMLRSFIRILASNYPLQIKLIEEVTKLYKIIIFQLNFAGLLEPSFKCSIKYACELCCFTT